MKLRWLLASVGIVLATASCGREAPQDRSPRTAGGTIREPIMRGWIALGGGHRAYRAAPQSGRGPRVVLLHTWWGLNDTFQQMAERLAGAGFVVVAPDLYDGVVVETIEDAEREVSRVAMSARMGAVGAAFRHLLGDTTSPTPAVGAVGFSLGAYYALELAAKEPALRAAVLFYGTGRPHDWARSRTSFLGHYAADDLFEPAADVEAYVAGIRRSGRRFDFHVYPSTGHWFMEPDRDAYDSDAAALAWERTIEFLTSTLARREAPSPR